MTRCDSPAILVIVGLFVLAVITIPIVLVTANGNARVEACSTIHSESLRAACINPPLNPVNACSSGASTAGQYSQPFPWQQCLNDLGRDQRGR